MEQLELFDERHHMYERLQQGDAGLVSFVWDSWSNCHCPPLHLTWENKRLNLSPSHRGTTKATLQTGTDSFDQVSTLLIIPLADGAAPTHDCR
jgi:hypothetical protein